MRTVSGIYRILNLKNGKCYVGSAASIYNRWASHRAALRRGKHKNAWLQQDWKSFGEDSFAFQILHQCPVPALQQAEQEYITRLEPEYNIRSVAGSRRGATPPHERIEGQRLHGYRRGVEPFSEEHRRNLQKAHAKRKGKPMSPEQKQAIVAGQKAAEKRRREAEQKRS